MQALTDESWVLVAHREDEPQVRAALGDAAVQFAFDREPGAGPLGALSWALEHVSGAWALLLAVDYPLVTSEFLKALKLYAETNAQDADVLVPSHKDLPQVACAFYRRSLHTELRDVFAKEERSLRRYVEGLPAGRVRVLAEDVWGRGQTRAPFGT